MVNESGLTRHIYRRYNVAVEDELKIRFGAARAWVIGGEQSVGSRLHSVMLCHGLSILADSVLLHPIVWCSRQDTDITNSL